MNLLNRFSKLIALTLSVAAMAVVGHTATAEAQSVRLFSATAIAGFIPGQSLRCSMAYMIRSAEGIQPVRAQVRLFDAQGNVIARGREVELQPGQFHTFIFNRDELAVEGEAGTGRVEVGVDFQFQADASQTLISAKNLLVTMETVDNRTGGNSSGTYYTGSVTVSDD